MKHELEKNQNAFDGSVPLRSIHIQVYEALDDFWKRNGYSPLLRDLTALVGGSPRTVQRALKVLLEKGYVERFSLKAWGNYKPIKHPNIYK